MMQVTTLMPEANQPISKMKLIEREGQQVEEEGKEDKALSKKQQKKMAKKNKKGGEAEATE